MAGRTLHHASVAVSAAVASTGLLEREQLLDALCDALSEASAGRGRLVFMSGEAGVGKTSVVARFREEHGPRTRILWGTCDGLFTPGALAPLVEVAEAGGPTLARIVQGEVAPHELAPALLRELTSPPSVLVLEDAHWADEATLDVLRLLGRRITDAPVLLIVTYRDDELDRAHPLRIVLGETATIEGVRRLEVPRLSPGAVAELAEPWRVDPDELYRATGGNPFFVTEALAAGGDEIPRTVRDAVLARAARLPQSARAVLDAAAVVSPRTDLWLLEALVGTLDERLDECLASGVLIAEDRTVSFRHELARRAIEDSLPPARRLALHRAALATLAAPPHGVVDAARLAHHADAAGDGAAVLRFAPEAAARARATGALREAAAQYGRAVRYADGLSPPERAALLELYSDACYEVDLPEKAIEALRTASECHRSVGDRMREGDTLRRLSTILWCPGRIASAREVGEEAVALLEELPPSAELALAYSNLGTLHGWSEDLDGTRRWSNQARELAERLEAPEIVHRALVNVATVEFLAGSDEGREQLEQALDFAFETEDEGLAARTYVSLGAGAVRGRRYELADRYLETGLERFTASGRQLARLYLLAYRAQVQLQQGQWSDAVSAATVVLRERATSTLPRTLAHSVLGLVRARRGDPGIWTELDAALAPAEGTGELQRLAPVASARAEAAWLEGRLDAVVEATDLCYAQAVSLRSRWIAGELACWRSRAGLAVEAPENGAEPYALELAGRPEEAARAWTDLGCPYEAALALAQSDDEGALVQALTDLQQLEARAAAAVVARRLRERGIRGLPRGPRASTRRNNAHLTARELEVLALLAEGLRNGAIATRLFLSPRTVDHHVSAILRKTQTRTRGEAVAAAQRLGLFEEQSSLAR